MTGGLDNWEGAGVQVDIDGSSIDTNNENGDSDLRGPEFFDVANHPNIAFRSTRINQPEGYGITWNRVIEAGGLVLADEVRIDVAVASICSPPPAE